MLSEILSSFITVIDLILKKKQYRDQFDDNTIAISIIQLLIALEKVEENANKIRWYFFYIERDKHLPDRVLKHKEHLSEFIPRQIEALRDVDRRIKSLTPMLRVYLEEHPMPEELNTYVFSPQRDYFIDIFSPKLSYLREVISSLHSDTEDFPFTRSETQIGELKKINNFKLRIAKLIKEQIPVVDFVKWYKDSSDKFERNELHHAREMREKELSRLKDIEEKSTEFEQDGI